VEKYKEKAKGMDLGLGLILEGMVGGKNPRGRPRIQHMSQIVEDQECNSCRELKRKASDREAWKLLQTNP